MYKKLVAGETNGFSVILGAIVKLSYTLYHPAGTYFTHYFDKS